MKAYSKNTFILFVGKKRIGNLFTILVIISFVFLGSCSIIKLTQESSKEKMLIHNPIQEFEFNSDNQILIPMTFDSSEERKLLFDLGAVAPVFFFNEENKPVIENAKIHKGIGRAIGADGKKIESRYVSFNNVKTNSFSIDNAFFMLADRDRLSPCNYTDGILGVSIFSGYQSKIIKVNMNDATLELLKNLPDVSDWQKLKVKYKKSFSFFYITSKINGVETDLFFDTGFSGNILLTKEDFLKTGIDKNNVERLYGHIFHTLGGLNFDTISLTSAYIHFPETNITDSTRLVVTEVSDHSLIGMGFLKNYDFIVDYDSRNIFMKPNQNTRVREESFFRKKGFTAKLNGKGEFIVFNITLNGMAHESGLQIGDEIISVNETDLASIELCQIQAKMMEMDGSIPARLVIKRGAELIRISL
jgi:predicted aspartyl protease